MCPRLIETEVSLELPLNGCRCTDALVELLVVEVVPPTPCVAALPDDRLPVTLVPVDPGSLLRAPRIRVVVWVVPDPDLPFPVTR